MSQDLSSIVDFFNTSSPSINSKNIIKKKEDNFLDREKKELKNELNENNLERPEKKERYRAIPKITRAPLEKISDRYSTKKIQINDEDFRFFSELDREIAIARRFLNKEDRSSYKISANTIIRIVLENFVARAKLKDSDTSKISFDLQSIEAIEKWVRSI